MGCIIQYLGFVSRMVIIGGDKKMSIICKRRSTNLIISVHIYNPPIYCCRAISQSRRFRVKNLHSCRPSFNQFSVSRVSTSNIGNSSMNSNHAHNNGVLVYKLE